MSVMKVTVCDYCNDRIHDHDGHPDQFRAAIVGGKKVYDLCSQPCLAGWVRHKLSDMPNECQRFEIRIANK